MEAREQWGGDGASALKATFACDAIPRELILRVEMGIILTGVCTEKQRMKGNRNKLL